MLNSLSARWQTIKTKFKKIIPFIFTLILFVPSLKVSALTPSYYNTPIKWYNSDISLQFYNTSWSSSVVGTYDNTLNAYYFNNSISSAYQFKVFSTYQTLDTVLPYDVPLKFVYYFYSNDITSVNDLNVNFIRSDIMYGDNNYLNCSQYTSVYRFSDRDTSGVVVLIDLPANILFEQPNGFRLVSSSLFSVPANCVFTGAIYNGNDISTNDILSAINTQTDFIVNGDSSTGGIVAGADSSKSELESIVADYQQIENNMLDNFTLYQSDILSDVTGWSWGGLSSCANWVGDTLTSYFQNMGDFKQFIIYPLLLGIALFFIGRGSSIIGHLYRKPTESYTFSERSSSIKYVNGQRITTSVTKSNRDGGVLRK